VWIGQVSLLAVLYVATGMFGLEFANYHQNATLVWPPTGLALAALILFGQRLWPGVFVGALCLNSQVAVSGWIAFTGIAIGNTLEAVVGTFLLVRLSDFRPNLERPRDAAVFLLFGVASCTLISSTIGISSLFLAGSVGADDIGLVWLIWWLGDVGGALVVAPLLFLLARGAPAWRALFRRREWWIAMALLVWTGWFGFSGVVSGLSGFAACIAPFPVVVWAGTRFGPRGATMASFVVILIATVATLLDSGPFVMGSDTEAIVLLWSYSLLISITAFALAAIIAQRDFSDLAYRSEESERLRVEKEKLLLMERERITREMHDGLGGQLVSTLALVERGLGSQSEIAEALRRALDDIRIVTDSLDPETTDLSTSLGKLRARLTPLLRRNGVDLEWRVEDVPGIHGIPPESTLHVLRIIQEAVTNALQHAQSDTVMVSVESAAADPAWLRVAIRDNGCGFLANAVGSGRGIRNMRTRADALHARFRIEAASPGKQVELDVPVSIQEPV